MQELPQQAFKEEAYELLSDLEDSLLELEENPADIEVIGKVFRAMHTIKGSGAMFGFTAISEFTHEVESVYDMVRNGDLQVDKLLVDLSLQARDHILALLSDADDDTMTAAGQTLISQFKKLSATVTGVNSASQLSDQSASNASLATSPAAETSAPPTKTFRIRFVPQHDILCNGTSVVNLLTELAQLGTSRVVAYKSDIAPLDELDPESCYVRWDVILTTSEDEDAIRDVFIFVEDDCELQIDEIGVSLDDADQDMQRLGDILVARGAITQAQIDEVLAKSKRIGDMLVDAKLVAADEVESALVEQQEVRKIKDKSASKIVVSSSLRVPSERLDELVNLVGEMVTVQSRLSQTAKTKGDAELESIAEEVERLTQELRDSTLNIRMLAIGSTFSKFKRLVRDISSDLGKQVELKTVGAETELDKTVIEQLNDPLVHIIRNSMDHGIEMPEVRRAQGKPEAGIVTLIAEHAGDSVVIEIRDDGKGLDSEVLRQKAISKGIISADAVLSENEIYQLIFAPGFSTAEKVTGLSGRGVGMDVVKRAIEALRGSIQLESTLGVGTTVRLRIPLTLAIIESLLVEIGGNSFVLPLGVVEECIELTQNDITQANGRCLANVRGSLIPYIPLRESFNLAGDLPDIQQIVITQINGRKLGFVVDNVIGEHQTVIKSLGPLYQDVSSVSGGTILGDGSIALILNLAQLMEQMVEGTS